MPTHKHSFIKSYPTPVVGDVLFYETADFSKKEWQNWEYGNAHPDSKRWPEHQLVSVQPMPGTGDNIYAIFYAAPRKDQDKYNWEHAKADLAGYKFDTIVRSYVIKREDYSATVPALGTVMPNEPKDVFAASNYVLMSRNQDRISQRGRRAQESIGIGELDSLYVVETRVYVDRTELVENVFDDSVNGPLFQRTNIYIRGDAVNDPSFWQPTSDGQISQFQQVSTDVWIVEKRDIIPQTAGSSEPPKFGGKVLRSYQTTIDYGWPSVLGDDGTEAPNALGQFGSLGDGAIEIMDWESKEGDPRNYVRPRYKRQSYRGPSKAIIHEEWLTQEQLDSADLDVIETLEPLPVYYPNPFMPVNLPPTLHPAMILKADTGTSDPTWGLNTGSARRYPATTKHKGGSPVADWPESLVADVNVRPREGGYVITHVTVFRPSD